MPSRHAVLMIAYNNVALTRQAVESILAQDVPGGVDLFFVNNGSTDGTVVVVGDMFTARDVEGYIVNLAANESPCKVANEQLAQIFSMGYGEVLCVPNDVILPPNLYSEFLAWPRGAVTASMTTSRDLPVFSPAVAVNECTPLAVVMWRYWAYSAIMAKDGYFLDENIFHYSSDCDLALRMAACGIRGVQLDLQYYHFGSASHLLAPPAEGAAMRAQADRDREYFAAKWGHGVADPYYGQCATDINFKGEPIK